MTQNITKSHVKNKAGEKYAKGIPDGACIN